MFMWIAQICSLTRREICHALLVMTMLTVGIATALADDDATAETDSAKAKSAARLATMRELAEQFKMQAAPGGDQKPFELRPKPIFRYSDQPRGFVDATLWAWGPAGSSGRPSVIAKIEAAVTPDKVPIWHFCVASLADGLVTADFEEVRRFAAAKPGFELRSIPGAPEPADKPAARQRQMKELVARFAATITNTNPDSKKLEPQEMRLLASPIHRYADEARGLVDGMIFGLTTNGTNPDMLVVIESQATANAPAAWKFGIVKMTIAEVHVRLDQGEVWMSPRNGPRETWDSFAKMSREE
jgi:hypothetical protein